MSWRDKLPLFRRELAPEPAGGGHDSSAAVATAELGADEAVLPLGAATAPLDDTTRTLSSSAPRLAAVPAERVLAAAALRDIGRERRENQDHCFAQILTFPA